MCRDSDANSPPPTLKPRKSPVYSQTILHPSAVTDIEFAAVDSTASIDNPIRDTDRESHPIVSAEHKEVTSSRREQQSSSNLLTESEFSPIPAMMNHSVSDSVSEIRQLHTPFDLTASHVSNASTAPPSTNEFTVSAPPKIPSPRRRRKRMITEISPGFVPSTALSWQNWSFS